MKYWYSFFPSSGTIGTRQGGVVAASLCFLQQLWHKSLNSFTDFMISFYDDMINNAILNEDFENFIEAVGQGASLYSVSSRKKGINSSSRFRSFINFVCALDQNHVPRAITAELLKWNLPPECLQLLPTFNKSELEEIIKQGNEKFFATSRSQSIVI